MTTNDMSTILKRLYPERRVSNLVQPDFLALWRTMPIEKVRNTLSQQWGITVAEWKSGEDLLPHTHDYWDCCCYYEEQEND